MKVVPINPVIFYRSVLPKITGGFFTEVDDCIQSLISLTKDTASDLFKLVVFHDPESETDYLNRKNYVSTALRKYFPGKCPTFVLIGQVPEIPYKVSFEAAFVGKGDFQVFYRSSGDHPYVVFESPGYKELWSSGLRGTVNGASNEEIALSSFEEAQKVLAAEGMSFNQVVRQWNYVGGILQKSPVNGTNMQNYQIFNEVRHSVYQQFRTIKGFPAATGIGDKLKNITLEICAVQAENGQADFAVENPKQVNPYDYSQKVLVGKPIHSQPIKHPPEFERAKMVIAPYNIRVFISGTASIIGQETIGIGDVEKQTHCTISNIESLVSPENLKRSNPGIPPGRFDYSYLRVYVKYLTDLEKVKVICRQKYPLIPITYTVADICRDDLLLEIEGEMVLLPSSGDN
jgi:hypothetical protein